MLTERVEAGELPELAERLPETPMVQELWKEPGQYGGTLRISQTTTYQSQIANAYGVYGLLEWNMDGTDGVPSLAESVEANEDNSVFTITLREGLKWSDGEPMTVDDVMFALKDVIQNKTLTPAPPMWFRNTDGSDPTVEEQDGKVVITFANSFSLFPRYIRMPYISSDLIKPKHYLKQFHPDYTDQAEVEAAAKEVGFDTWDQLFSEQDNRWNTIERPTAGPYVLTTAADGQTQTASYERNPYYHKTDPDGRQLPYIDHVQAMILDDETLNLRAAGGNLDLQGMGLTFMSTGLLQDSAEANGYDVLRWRQASTQINLFPNLSHPDEVTREIFQNVDFRAAISHAINREEMNTQMLGGAGSCRQFTPEEGDDYYLDGSGTRFLEYDLATANQLLDDLGLDQRNGDGTRLMANGEPLDFVVTSVETMTTVPVSDALEFVAQAWQDVGIKLTLKTVDVNLFYQLRDGNDFDFIQDTGHMLSWDMEPKWFVPGGPNFATAPAYGEWHQSAGESGMEPTEEFKDLWGWWNELVVAPTDEERIALGQRIAKQWDEQVYVLGLIDIPFRPVVASKKLGNVRDDEDAILVYFHGFEGVTKPEQLHLLP